MTRTAKLQAAYLRTTYWVDAAPEPIGLRIGEPNKKLDRLLGAQNTSCCAFITAWNPHSELSPVWRNVSRHRALLSVLKRSGIRWLNALAQGDQSDWPPEPGVLMLGIGRSQAVQLGRRFAQNAVVIGRRGAAAQLAWCKSETRSAKGRRAMRKSRLVD